MKQVFAFILLASSSLAFSGNGSSGGGGTIHGDQLNPWFIQNTKTVNYCVEIAPEFSLLPREKILGLIYKSFADWKETFANHAQVMGQDLPVQVTLATQDFVYEEQCSASTDLKFQLGFLTEDQKKEIPTYRQLLGLAYRTSYDQATLKGKGFIYVAPETGALRPQMPSMHVRPWSTGKNLSLQYLLRHELGHIFGLQDDHYTSSSLMSAKFAENIVNKNTISYVNSTPHVIPSPFGCNAKFDGNLEYQVFQVSRGDVEVNRRVETLTDDLRQVLGLPKSYNADFKSNNGTMKILIDGKEFAQIDLKQFGHTSGDRMDSAISIYLTKKQTVLKNLKNRMLNTHMDLYHMQRSVTRKNEVMKLASGREFDVFIKYDQQCSPSVGTIYNDELYFDLFSGN